MRARINEDSTMPIKRVVVGAILMVTCVVTSGVCSSMQELDGRQNIFKDPGFDRLVGNWKMRGKVMGNAVTYDFKAEWVLNHQFLQLHMKDAGNPQGYEAMVYLGYDNRSERYVAHWMDVFGGRFSETLGFGRRSGNSTKFIFEYPDGPFHTTFTWDPTTKAWNILMEQKDKAGKW